MNINELLSTAVELLSSPSFDTIQAIALGYVGLLWLSIVIWVTRDSIERSDSLIFQVFSILINIAFPVLGILLYLIMRPSKTTSERFYEELEHRLLMESLPKEEKKTDTKVAAKKPTRAAAAKKTPKK